jgi:hypothetical protein
MFTQEKIDTIAKFYEEIETLKSILDNEYIKSFEGSDERKRDTPTRKDVPENNLWYEVQNLGDNCEAGKLLREIYPKVFESADNYNRKVSEMNAYALKELNIDPLKITFLDIIRIAKGVKDMV